MRWLLATADEVRRRYVGRALGLAAGRTIAVTLSERGGEPCPCVKTWAGVPFLAPLALSTAAAAAIGGPWVSFAWVAIIRRD
jgi:hypothetical protein